jgi:hypothetical protein
MSLSKRLSSVVPVASNNGCRTCHYVSALSDADLQAFDDWLAGGNSATQLWEVCCADPDNPLDVTISGFRNHMKHHKQL